MTTHRAQSEPTLLTDLPVIPALEFFDSADPFGDPPEAKPAAAPSEEPNVEPKAEPIFTNERAYRFCQAVIEQPLRPSSQYPKLVGVGTKTALTLRKQLVKRGYIVERTVESSGRGRSTILVEATAAGIEAVNKYEAERAK